jgi:hypothetical protein
MFLNDSDLRAIWLTMRLAGIVTLILPLLGTPIAYGRRAARCVEGWRVVGAMRWWCCPRNWAICGSSWADQGGGLDR